MKVDCPYKVCEYSLNIGSRQLNIFQLSDFSLQWDRLPIEMMLSNFWPFITCEQKVPQQKLLKSNILFWRDCDFKRMVHSLFTLSLFSISWNHFERKCWKFTSFKSQSRKGAVLGKAKPWVNGTGMIWLFFVINLLWKEVSFIEIDVKTL